MDTVDGRSEGPQALAALLKAARQRAGLTFRGAAQLSRSSEAWWRQVEDGVPLPDGRRRLARPAPDRIVRAARAVGVAPEAALRAAGYDPAAVTIVEVPAGAEYERSLLMAIVGNEELSEADLRIIRRLVAAYLETDMPDTASDHAAGR